MRKLILLALAGLGLVAYSRRGRTTGPRLLEDRSTIADGVAAPLATDVIGN